MFGHLKQLERRSLKKIKASTGFEPVTSAIKVKNDHGRYELSKLASLPMCGFIAQLVEHRTGIAEVTGSNPVEALIFFRLLLSNCLNWKIYCDDHSSLLSHPFLRDGWSPPSLFETWKRSFSFAQASNRK